MQPLEIIIGALFAIGAVIAIFVAFDSETVVALGVAVIFGAAGAFSMYHGIHGEHVKFYDKHAAILRDITRQGFHVPSDHVFAVGGNYLYGTEVNITAGTCKFIFPVTNLDGIWRVTLPRRDGNGVTVISPGAVANLSAACSGKSA